MPCIGPQLLNGTKRIAEMVRYEPRFVMLRPVFLHEPRPQGSPSHLLFGINEEQLQPALLAFWQMQIWPAGELRFRVRPRSDPGRVQQIEYRCEARAILPA